MDRPDQRRPYWRHDDDDDDIQEFQEQHAGLSERVERFLLQLIALGLVLLALVQTLHTNSTARRMLNLVEGLEGVPWTQAATWSGLGEETVSPVSASTEPLLLTVVCITRRSAPAARLLIDGKQVGTFASGSLTVPVRRGQVVSVDGSKLAEPLIFRVVGPPELISPALGLNVNVVGEIRPLGVVQTGN